MHEMEDIPINITKYKKSIKIVNGTIVIKKYNLYNIQINIKKKRIYNKLCIPRIYYQSYMNKQAYSLLENRRESNHSVLNVMRR